MAPADAQARLAGALRAHGADVVVTESARRLTGPDQGRRHTKHGHFGGHCVGCSTLAVKMFLKVQNNLLITINYSHHF